MKVIASAIAAALTTTTATVSLAAMVAIAPAVDEEVIFEAPAAEIVAIEAETEITEIAIPRTVATDEAVAETAAEAAEAAEAEEAPELTIAHTGEGAEDDTAVMTPGTINVGGNVLGYIDYFEAAAAPEHGAGLWLGSDSTTDGSWGYFIGHNPGDFSAVMELQGGDAVTVCDRDGNFRTYYVVDAFTVTTETYWSDIEERVTGYGESIMVQTCCGDNVHYRVVVCA